MSDKKYKKLAQNITHKSSSKRRYRICPKKLIIDYIDAMIAQVDIYTEETLNRLANPHELIEISTHPDIDHDDDHDTEYDSENEYYGRYDDEKIEKIFNDMPYKNEAFIKPDRVKSQFEMGATKAVDYLNGTRDEMIRVLNETQTEALRQLEAVKNELDLDATDQDVTEKTDRVMEKVFGKKFPFLLQIKTKSKYFNYFKTIRLRDNRELDFHMYLVVLDIYLDAIDMASLGYDSFILLIKTLYI